MRYTTKQKTHRWPKRLTIILIVGVLLIAGATFAARMIYDDKLQPVSTSQQTKLIEIEQGASVDDIAQQLEREGLIQSAWAFKLYVSRKQARNDLQAGTYAFSPSLSVAEIISKLTHGRIAANNVTILPAQRIDEIRASLINSGFSPEDVDTALNPASYVDNPALVDKPVSASLEGYIYPDTFQKTGTTTAKTIIEQSLAEMEKHLTPELRQAFAKQGLSTYQAIILASIVENEVSSQTDRNQAAQVFLSRLRQDIPLGSDVTAPYGAILAGKNPSLTYDSPYNTYKYRGLPPTPISNVSGSSLRAVAYPSNTDWLYFVAGDDGVTHFSKTLEEHEALTKQYCHRLCQ